MIAEIELIAGLGAGAFVVSACLTYAVGRWALRRGYVDEPGPRKIHAGPVALGGGIVVFWVVIGPITAAALLVTWWDRRGGPGWLPEALSQHVAGLADKGPAVLVLAAAAALLHVTGLIDDRRRLGPWVKLTAELIVAAGLVIWGQMRMGFFIDNVWISGAVSVVWIVVVINAFNFLDNMDGLSAGCGIICSAMILAVAVGHEQWFVSGLLALLIGALLGFLVFNFFPAKIFLGDAGSLLTGLLIAAATIRTTYYHEAVPNGYWFATLTPLIVLAVPLYDFAGVVLLRLAAGASPFVGDNRHFSHRLVGRGMTQPQAVLTIYLTTACTGLGATFLGQVRPSGAVLILVQTLLILLIIAILEKRPLERGKNGKEDGVG